MSVGDLFSMEWLWFCRGQYGLTRFQYVVDFDPLNLANGSPLIDTWTTDLVFHLTPCLSSDTSLLRMRTYRTLDHAFNRIYTLSFAGSVASQSTLFSVAYGIQIIPTIARGVCGAMRVPGVPKSFTANGNLTSTGKGLIGLFCANLHTAIQNSRTRYRLCLWERPRASLPSGRVTIAKIPVFRRITTQVSRRGNKNDQLKTQFGL